MLVAVHHSDDRRHHHVPFHHRKVVGPGSGPPARSDPGVVPMTATPNRRLWRVAGWLALAHIVTLFVGVALVSALELGDKPSVATDALVGSSLPKNYVGGMIQFVGFLVFLVFAMLLARLLRGHDDLSSWLSSCIAASAITYVAVTVATGFAAGAAALYDGHHGAPLTTVTTVDDIRNFGFVLCSGVVGLFSLAVAAAGRATAALPRWVWATGAVVGVLSIVAVAGARAHVTDISTMLWFVWFTALGVALLRKARRATPVATATAPVPA
jgi:hypothetical protein